MAGDAHTSDSTRDVEWAVVYALAALQLVITLGWMAYAHFHDLLLERFGFGSLKGFLALYLAVVGATLAPLVGSIADRIAQRGGHRFSVVVAGGLLAGATFVAVASTVAVRPDGPLRWLLLVLILVWIAAMTILQTPALSLLPQVASAAGWPVVASPLVVATVLPTALWPFVHRVLDDLGGPATFLAGGAFVLAATFALRGALSAVVRESPPPRAPDGGTLTGTALSMFPVLFGVGITSAFITRLASDVAPALFASRLGGGEATAAPFSTVALGTGGLLAPWLGPLGAAVGARRGVLWSSVIALLCGIIAPLCTSIASAVTVATVLGAALAMHLDCSLPFSLGAISRTRTGLSAGLYLGGVFAGSQLAGLTTALASVWS